MDYYYSVNITLLISALLDMWKEDASLYFRNSENLPYHECLSLCSQFLGFRLTQGRTEAQMNAMRSCKYATNWIVSNRITIISCGMKWSKSGIIQKTELLHKHNHTILEFDYGKCHPYFNTRMIVRSFLTSTESSIGCKIINSAWNVAQLGDIYSYL